MAGGAGPFCAPPPPPARPAPGGPPPRARALVAKGARPVLAGRNMTALKTLAEELGGLETARADVEEPRSVRALVERDDVLVTTVGPFLRYGQAALEAAVDAGAHYIDCTGEPP